MQLQVVNLSASSCHYDFLTLYISMLSSVYQGAIECLSRNLSFPPLLCTVIIGLYVMNCMHELLFIHCIIAAPIKLDQSGASATVTINSNLTLTVDVSADPKPGAVWLLNGGDLADTSIASVK